MKCRIEKVFASKTILIILLLLIGCVFLSTVIPPLKSPDEHEHIKRAYLLGKGVFILDQSKGASSGGYIDTGLLEYFKSYPIADDRLSARGLEAANEIKWTSLRLYVPAPGTGYYFPLIYAPQTVGLVAGETLGLTVDKSYRLARATSLFAVLLLIFAAFRISAANPLVLALIVMPMSLFQFSSAGLDGIAVAWALFAVSVFIRAARDKSLAPAWSEYALAIAVVILATSRIHTLPMVFLLVAAFFHTRKKRALYLFAASMLFVLGWTFIAVKSTVDLRVAINESTFGLVSFYFQNPVSFAQVLWSTVSDYDTRDFYYRTFLGVLGWLDAPFEKRYYNYFGLFVFVIAALTVSLRGIRDEWPQRVWLILVALASIIFIFFALLVTWTPHPADKIQGVQGRYFLIPAVLLAYGIAGTDGLFGNLRGKLATFLCLMFFLFSVSASTSLMLYRYYLPPFVIPDVSRALAFSA
ncbi:DUF2142 domain-containing protein [Alcaligenaceae bacterium]|nr:DUF2142 domain-containing protein [Alcaligenaceae bacterium]